MHLLNPIELALICFFSAFFPVAALACLVKGTAMLRTLLRAQISYEPTLAVIVSSEIAPRGTTKRHGYVPVVRFTYTAAGQTFTGERYRLFDLTVDRSIAGARSVCAAYPPGTTHQAFYDPARPEVAVLRRSAWCDAALFLMLGTVFAPFALAGSIFLVGHIAAALVR